MPRSSARQENLKSEIRVRLILEKPPEGVDYGLQEGHGSSYKIIQTQRSSGKNLTFNFAVGVKIGKTSSFIGPFVQGTSNDKFFYISIGACAGQADSQWSRRLKVPLSGITQKMIDAGKILEASIPGASKDGSPSCAYAWRKECGSGWGWRILR
jgi:hypothetical protein